MPPSPLASATLARWLGPWGGVAAPPGIDRGAVELAGSAPFRAYVYRRRRAPLQGTYLVTPGLHHLGPDDPRLDRFCRVLAAAGFLVVAPFLPAPCDLRVAACTADDLAVAFDRAEALARAEGLGPPALFSISFGSFPAIALAARDGHRDRVASLVLFGGFADFEATVRFTLTGRIEHAGRTIRAARDPLNPPVVFLNLLPWLPEDVDRGRVERAWRRIVAETWGRMELKAAGARDPIAQRIAADLAPRERELFLVGCDLAPGAPELLERCLAAAGDAFAFARPREHLSRVAAPVAIVHGRDDDVIPCCEAEKLAAALPAGHPRRVRLTGFYHHTGASLPRPAELWGEARAMLDILGILAAAPHGRVG